MKIYTVCWSEINHGNGDTSAYCDTWSAHKTLEDAKLSLEKCKDEVIAEFVHGLEGDELDEAYDRIDLTGSVDKGYFEINNNYDSTTYIRISEVNL